MSDFAAAVKARQEAPAEQMAELFVDNNDPQIVTTLI
jgi:hypothetical protein